MLGNQAEFGFEVPARTESVEDVGDPNAATLFAVVTKTKTKAKAVPAGPGQTVGTRSRLLYAAIGRVYDGVGFDAVGDEVFRDLVIARIVEPTSKLDSLRVLNDLGSDALSYRTIQRHLRSIITGNYRDVITKKCFAHSGDRGTLSLLLYDVTTLYFEAENEDELRKVGYSKERRVDPQSWSACWWIGPGSRWRSAVLKETPLRPPRSCRSSRPSRNATGWPGSRWSSPLMAACCPGRI